MEDEPVNIRTTLRTGVLDGARLIDLDSPRIRCIPLTGSLPAINPVRNPQWVLMS
jgi:hypothetical protein